MVGPSLGMFSWLITVISLKKRWVEYHAKTLMAEQNIEDYGKDYIQVLCHRFSLIPIIISFCIVSMRDQPFKRYFPSQKKISKETYKYPSYQHYYEPRVSEINPISSKNQSGSTDNIQDSFRSPTKKIVEQEKASNKTEAKSNLKIELEHLKNEVHKIMEKKQGILRSPIEKKFAQRQKEPENTFAEDSDSQSVTSEKIFGETAKKIQLKRVTENYDYSKYIELQNNLLKTELRNLKSKYLNKKKELTQKCNAMEEKVSFLEIALFKSEQSLSQEVATLKETIKMTQNLQKQQNIPTSDKDHNAIIDQLNERIADLTKTNEEIIRKYEQKQANSFEEIISGVKAQYEIQIRAIELQKQSLEEKYEENAQKDKEELKSIKAKCAEHLQLYDKTDKMLQEYIAKYSQRETQFLQTVKTTESKYQQLISNLKSQFNAKIAALSPKKEKTKEKELSMSHSPSKKQDNQISTLRSQLKRWKVEYKLLKERYESYMKIENESKSQLKEYYRGYRQIKNKVQVLSYKNKVLQKEFEKYMKLISSKDASILKNEIQIRKIGNELAVQKQKFSKESIQLKDRCKALQQRLTQQTQRAQKQTTYRKQIEEKLLNSPVSDEAIKECLDRAKKRLAEQDEKISKSVKQLKNKETLITKLKQQLRELMESANTEVQKKSLQQTNQLIEDHIKSEESSIFGLNSRLQQEKTFLEELQKKFLDEVEGLKLENQNLKKQMVDTSNELKIISHAYYTKTEQLESKILQKDEQIESLNEKASEVEAISFSLERSLRQEIQNKNEEIDFLRKQVVAKHSLIPMPINASFDEALRNQIEGNNKLREQSLKKAQEIYKMRDNYTTLRSQFDNLKSENDINKLKFLSQKKNLQVGFQAQIQNYKNIIDNWEKKVTSLEQKIKIFIEENKKKDQFIQNFIIGKRLSQNQKEILADFMKQYEISVVSKDLVERLMTESKTIENLQKSNESLLKEVATLKQKLFMFEAIDVDKISLYESIVSRKSHRSIEPSEYEEVKQFDSQSKLKKTISMQDFTAIESEL